MPLTCPSWQIFSVQHSSFMPLLLKGGGGGDLHRLLLLGTLPNTGLFPTLQWQPWWQRLATPSHLQTSVPSAVSNLYWTTRTPFKLFIFVLEMRKTAPSTGWTSYPGRLMPTTAFRARNKGCRSNFKAPFTFSTLFSRHFDLSRRARPTLRAPRLDQSMQCVKMKA